MNLEMELEGSEAGEQSVNRSRCRPFEMLTAIYRYRGLVAAFVSAVFYSCLTLIVSNLKGEISVSELIFVRGCVASVLSLIIMCYNGTKILISTLEELKFHLVNSTLLVATIYCQYYAIQNMPAADATAITYCYVALSGLFGRIFLKETFGILELLLVLVTFSGVILIARPPFLFQSLENQTQEELSNEKNVLAPITAGIASLTVASILVVLRKMGKRNYDVIATCFYTMLSCIIVPLISTTLSNEWKVPCPWAWCRVLASAVSGYLGYAACAYALSFENTIYVSLVSLNEVIIVFCVTVIFFSYVPNWTSILGVVLILGSSVAILVRKIMLSENEKKRQTNGESGDGDV